MAHVRTTTWPVLDTEAICASQNVAQNGSFVINGTLASAGSYVSNGTVVSTNLVTFDGYCRTISFVSANNLTGVTFTITGYVNGVLTTESVAGNFANTPRYSTNFYSSIQSITSNTAVNAVLVGSGQTGYIDWFLSDSLSAVANLTVAVTVTDDVEYTFQVTLDDVTTTTSPNVFIPTTVPSMSGASTSEIINYTAPSFYSRILVVSTNDTGTFTAQFLQQGVR
jgi:hypothetical protein